MIEIENLKPFPKFCYTIGMIPTSYKESLTYEEQLIWFCDFLQNTVIPTVNNNGLAVKELQNLYVELKSYVDNYFENLDVQEEINKKLDDMAEQGTLQEIITSYLQIAGVLAFNNVSEMKASTNLINGSFVKTYGYYSLNDNGGSLYKIRNKTEDDIPDNMKIIELNDNTLVAEFIQTSDFINAMQYGLNTTDTSANITSKINSILNFQENLLFDNLSFTINDKLTLKSNTKLKFQNCNITNENITNQKYILDLDNIENVEIKALNSSLEFTKPNTTQQACIHITSSKNIRIDGFNLKKAGGDGIIVSGTDENLTDNVIISNCSIDNNRRNGISLIGGCENIIIDNCKIINTSGTNPQYAIDLEPWQDTLFNKFIIIKNCYFNGNVGGIDIMQNNQNITITNNNFDGNGINSVLTVALGKEKYPKHCNINNNRFNNTMIYLKGTQFAEYNILNNKFDKSKIVTDTESDFTSITTGIPKTGFLNIKNNIINESNGHALSLSGSNNVNIKDNLINDCSLRAFTILASNNVNIENNIIRNYQMSETATEASNMILIQTSKNVDLINNSFYKDETIDLTLTNLIVISANANNVKLINNKATIGNYTNFISNSSPSVLIQNNETKTLYNDTTKFLPTASEKYLGQIYNYYYSPENRYRPRMCIYNNGAYSWKYLDE